MTSPYISYDEEDDDHDHISVDFGGDHRGIYNRERMTNALLYMAPAQAVQNALLRAMRWAEAQEDDFDMEEFTDVIVQNTVTGHYRPFDHHPERFDESNEKFLNAATIVATDDSYRTPEITHADPKDAILGALERIKNLPTTKGDPSYGES